MEARKYLKKAIEIAGSQSALARALGVTQTHVWNWLNRNKQIPAEYILKIENFTGVSRYKLRPDIYQKD